MTQLDALILESWIALGAASAVQIYAVWFFVQVRRSVTWYAASLGVISLIIAADLVYIASTRDAMPDFPESMGVHSLRGLSILNSFSTLVYLVWVHLKRLPELKAAEEVARTRLASEALIAKLLVMAAAEVQLAVISGAETVAKEILVSAAERLQAPPNLERIDES